MSNSHFINNQWQEGAGPAFTSTDPATDQPVAQFHAATPAEVDQAVQSARQAFQTWSLLPIEKRTEYLTTFADLLKKEKARTEDDALPTLISREMGKPHWESLTELDAMINKISLSIQAIKERRSDSVQVTGA